MTKICTIILAAGKGTRFKSDQPKVLHTIHQKPMVHHVLDAVQNTQSTLTCLVVGYQQEAVKESCANYAVHYAIQDQQLGTGHAVSCAMTSLTDMDLDCVVVVAGDCPLIQSKTLDALITHHLTTGASATVLTATLPDAGQYGRIIRDESGSLLAIREAKDCTDDQRLIQEFNSGIYCFNREDLRIQIGQLSTQNAQQEYYLTDVIEALSRQQKRVESIGVNNALEVSGANTPAELEALASASL